MHSCANKACMRTCQSADDEHCCSNCHEYSRAPHDSRWSPEDLAWHTRTCNESYRGKTRQAGDRHPACVHGTSRPCSCCISWMIWASARGFAISPGFQSGTRAMASASSAFPPPPPPLGDSSVEQPPPPPSDGSGDSANPWIGLR